MRYSIMALYGKMHRMAKWQQFLSKLLLHIAHSMFWNNSFLWIKQKEWGGVSLEAYELVFLFGALKYLLGTYLFKIVIISHYKLLFKKLIYTLPSMALSPFTTEVF